MTVDFSEPDRKLAAILAADVVGFSRMMGEDEQGTLSRMHAARELVIDPILVAHRGRIFKVLGDGLLVEFSSVVLALRAAVAVQTQLLDHSAEVAATKRIVLRIGVHQGDVVVHGSDLLGDGVNIAARLEALAPPGGVCISARVREDAAGKLPFPVIDGGERALKNIARPMHVFFVQVGAQAEGKGGTVRTEAGAMAARPAESSEDATMISSGAKGVFSLVVVETAPQGPAAGQALALDQGPLTLGRQAPSDVILPSGQVSRRHCRVEKVGHAAVVTDLGSTNGTYLDERRIEVPTELRPGSVLRVGPFVMRYVAGAPKGVEDADATHVFRPGSAARR